MSKVFVCAEFKGQAIKVTRQKLEEIWLWFPILKEEIESEKMSTDYIELTFKNGSIFSIVGMTASSRGTRSSSGVIEESALIENCDIAA